VFSPSNSLTWLLKCLKGGDDLICFDSLFSEAFNIEDGGYGIKVGIRYKGLQSK